VPSGKNSASVSKGRRLRKISTSWRDRAVRDWWSPLPALVAGIGAATNGGRIHHAAGGSGEGVFSAAAVPSKTLAEFCQTHEIPFLRRVDDVVEHSQPEQLYLNNAAAFRPTGIPFMPPSSPSFCGSGCRKMNRESPGLSAPIATPGAACAAMKQAIAVNSA